MEPSNATLAPNIEVRQLTPSDLARVMRASEGVFDNAIVPARAAEFLSDPRHLLIAALDGDRIVGFASAVVYVHPDKAQPELWINEVGVAETHHRRGIGRRLMQETIEAARHAGCSVVWVQTEADNTAARALYRATGAEEKSGVILYEIKLS
jgi:aminoglycoside 6'-N-acetyltransferase I